MNMKELYESPEVEVIIFDTEDIITDSVPTTEPTTAPTTAPTDPTGENNLPEQPL